MTTESQYANYGEAMGQPVAVVVKPTSRPGTIRLEANRTLTGMGHERFTSSSQALGNRPAAVLARRLLDTNRVDAVHIYQNIVTVDIRKGFDATGMEEILEKLHTYYLPGVVPPSIEELLAKVETDVVTASAPSSDGTPVDPAASKVPAHLLARSASARARAANA